MKVPKHIALILSLALAVLLCLSACSKQPVPQAAGSDSDAAEAEVTDTEKTEAEETDAAGSTASNSYTNQYDEATRALAEKYFDFDAYAEKNGNIYNNTTDVDALSVEVDGITLTLGMTYADVIATGIQLADPADADEELMNSFSVVVKFQTPSGGIFSLAMSGEEGQKLTEGTVYDIKVNGKSDDHAAVLSVSGLTSGVSTLKDVISAFGETPKGLDVITYDGVKTLLVTYFESEHQAYVRFGIDPSSETVFQIGLEGYAD